MPRREFAGFTHFPFDLEEAFANPDTMPLRTHPGEGPVEMWRLPVTKFFNPSHQTVGARKSYLRHPHMPGEFDHHRGTVIAEWPLYLVADGTLSLDRIGVDAAIDTGPYPPRANPFDQLRPRTAGRVAAPARTAPRDLTGDVPKTGLYDITGIGQPLDESRFHLLNGDLTNGGAMIISRYVAEGDRYAWQPLEPEGGEHGNHPSSGARRHLRFAVAVDDAGELLTIQEFTHEEAAREGFTGDALRHRRGSTGS